jgi:hypothetical protein
MSRLRSALRILPMLALDVTVLTPTHASQPLPPPSLSRDTAISLLREGNASLAIYRDRQTGIPNFLAGTLPRVSADVATPVEAGWCL